MVLRDTSSPNLCSSATVLPVNYLSDTYRVVAPGSGQVIITGVSDSSVQVTAELPNTMITNCDIPSPAVRNQNRVTITLGRGDAYRLRCRGRVVDPTGMLLTAASSISVWMVSDNFIGHAIPVDRLGTEYLVQGIRVVAHYPNTIVSTNIRTYPALNAGEKLDILTDNFKRVSSNYPIAVGISKTSQGQNSVSVTPAIPLLQAKATYVFDVPLTGSSFLTIYAETAETRNIVLDGRRIEVDWTPIDGKPSWSLATLTVSNSGVHELYHATLGKTFIAYIDTQKTNVCRSTRPLGMCLTQVIPLYNFLSNFIIIFFI